MGGDLDWCWIELKWEWIELIWVEIDWFEMIQIELSKIVSKIELGTV